MKHLCMLALLLAACAPPARETEAVVPQNAAEPLQAPAQWTCEDGREMTVSFYGERVEVTFAEGRKVSLPAVVAASGEAYEADAVRFHAKGDDAYIAEGETVTNCKKKSA